MLIYIGAGCGLAVATGVYLKWAVGPAVIAFGAGLQLGRTLERTHPTRPGLVPAFRVGYRFGRRDRP